MVAKGRKTKKNGSKARMGRLMSPVDVRSADKIGAFENMLGKGPLTLVLVYADWCGHCHRFKKDTWKDLTAMSNRKMNIASVRDDMLPKTSLSKSTLKGYPSLMLVGTDKRAAEFKDEENEVTNALPSNEKKDLQSLLQTPLPNVNATLSANLVTPVKTVSAPMEPSTTVNSRPPSPAANLRGSLKPPTPTMKPMNSAEVDEDVLNTPISATMPPDASQDMSQEPLELTPSKTPVGGGNLLTSLIRLAKSGTKAFMKKRRTVKRKAGRKGTKKGK